MFEYTLYFIISLRLKPIYLGKTKAGMQVIGTVPTLLGLYRFSSATP